MSDFTPLKISVIEFFESSAILNIKTLSPAQKVILKVINGETLDTFFRIPILHPMQEREFENEVDLFLWMSGKDHYAPGVRYLDVSLCSGRRSGKSLVIGAGLIIYYATQKSYMDKLGTSPHATVPIISPTKAQANEVYQAVKRFFLQSPYLFQVFLGGNINSFEEIYDEKATEESRFIGAQIKLTNRVVIKTMTADVSNIRGFSCPLWLTDEVCFFGTGGDIKSSDKGIVEAITPSTAQYGDDAFGLKISSPNGESGLMYEDYLNRKEEHVLHLQAPTWLMNPSISMKFLERERKKGEHYFQREFAAQYNSSENSYLDPKTVDSCQLVGIDRIPYQPGYRYVSAMDYATKVDVWAFSIGHKEHYFEEVMVGGKMVREKLHRVVCDVLVHWQGSQGSELDPSSVIQEISEFMREYRVANIVCDQYAYAAVKNLFEQHGQTTKEFKASLQSKKKYMYSLQVAVNSGTLRYVSNKMATKHLKDLREKRGSNGQIKIEAVTGGHDDYATAIGMVVYQFDSSSPLYIGQTKDDEEVITPETKDLAGAFIAMPSAQDMAEITGNVNFVDNTQEYLNRKKAKESPEPALDETSDFWFSF